MSKKQKELIAKIMFIGLFLLVFVMVIVPDYRYLALLFYVFAYITYLLTTKKIKIKPDIKRLLYVLYFASGVDLIVMFASPSYFNAGLVYFIIGSFCWLFINRRIK